MAEIAIGIDLGTSNSCVAVARRTRGELAVEVLPNAYGETITASVVAFGEDGKTIVGNAARANIIHDPHNTVSSSKRLIGRYFFSEEVKKARAVCSYAIVEGPNHGVRIRVRGQDYALPEISAMVLREMKQIAELRLGQPVSKAVITVPAYFNDNQRQATKDAGRIAGLDVLRILNEPTAAALAYGFGKGLSQRVAIYDLGGGTFDISVLEIGKDVFEVLSTCGDTFLGGDDFDDRLIDLLADEFVAKQGFNLRSDPFALEKLKVAAEAAKRGLSMDEEVEINIPDIVMGPDGQPRSVQRRLTQAEYASLVMDLVMRTFKVCDEALQQANVVARDLAGVILVGGPTRLPLIRQAVRDYFQQEPRTDVNPDEVVAMGAAIHAASLVAPEQDAFLLDVTPLSLRIGVAGGLAETVIERNTPVPIEQTRVFTTFQDFQESVKIRVYQGESRQAEENELLGQFEFSGFKKARRGEVKIEVSFEINSDGIVNVMARDPDGGQQASTTITLSSGLSEGEIQAILAKGAPEAPAPEKPIARPVAPPSTRPVASPRPAGRPLPVADDELDVLPDELPALPDLGPSTLDAQTEVAPVAPASKAAVPASAESGIPAASAPPDPDLEITGGYAQAPPPALAPDVGLDVGELEGAPDELVPLEGGEDLFDRHSADLSGGTDDLVVEIDLDPGPRKA